jgi:hypothetical protein
MRKFMIIEIPCDKDGTTTPSIGLAVGLIAGHITAEMRKAGVDPVRITYKAEEEDCTR